MNDGDWICNEQNCGNINFARRTSCYRCNAEKPETDKASKKKLGTEIGKSAADKSRGLFNADDWQCNKCANVNWARRSTCNVCNAPKFGEVEARTGYGGGYNERGVVEYRRREGSSDDEYDEFGRKKRKQQRSDTEDKVGITEGAEFKNLLPKPQMELKVRNCMPAPATQNKAFTERNRSKGRYSDSRHSHSSSRENQTFYKTTAYKNNTKNMNSNRANSFYQSRQNRKRSTSLGDKEHTGSSGYETGTKKARKDSTDSPVFMPSDPVMENMITSTKEVVYKFNGAFPSQNFEVTYNTKERVIAAAYAIAYNNCKISTERFESLFDKPAPDFKTIFAWRQRLLGTGCLDDTHQKIKTSGSKVIPVRVPNPDEIAIISSESEEESAKVHLPSNPGSGQQRCDSVETVILERTGRDTQGSKSSFETGEARGPRKKNHSATSHKGTRSSSSESRNSDSSYIDSEQLDRKSTKSKTSNRSSRPTITSARQSVMDSDSESVSYNSDEDNFLSRKFGDKKVRPKFKRRNTVAPPPATCCTSEKAVTYVPQVTQPPTNIINTSPYQGYSTANQTEKSPLTTGNIYTLNLRNMNAKTLQNTLVDADGGSCEYVPTRIGATAKNNYQDFKNNVRLSRRPGYWARANGSTLSTKRITPGVSQQNKTPVKRSISTYIPPVNQANPNGSRVLSFGKLNNSTENEKKSCIPELGAPNKSPEKKHITSYIPGYGKIDASPRSSPISTFVPIETQNSSLISGLTGPDKSPVIKQSSPLLPSFYDPNESPIVQKQNSSIPGEHESPPVKHKSSSISGMETNKIIRNYTGSASTENQNVLQNKCYNKINVDITQDNLDRTIAGDHYLPFDRSKKGTPQFDQDSCFDQDPSFDPPPKPEQKADPCLSKVDQIPLPENPLEETDGIFSVFQKNTPSDNVIVFFENSLNKQSTEREYELDKYENTKGPHATLWDEDDDALYGESGVEILDKLNMPSSNIKTTQAESNTINTSNQSSSNKQTNLLNEKKKMLMGLLNNMEMNNDSEQSLQYHKGAQQSSPNETFYGHAQSHNTQSGHTTQSQNPVNILTDTPEPMPLELSEELMRMSEHHNANASDEDCLESSTTKTVESGSKNIRDTKRIRVIESITFEPIANVKRNSSKKTPQLDLKPVKVISQQDMETASENIEILVSSDDQEPSPSPSPPLQPQPLLPPLPPQPPLPLQPPLPPQPPVTAPLLAQADFSKLLAGINADTLMLALKNLQQLANNSQNSSFSSTQNNPEQEEKSDTGAEPVDTINLTNDEWEQESVGEGSIERRLEEMDGNPAATPFLSEIFDPTHISLNVTRKLNIDLKIPDISDVQKPDENAPLMGNFKSFVLPKPPRLSRVKVPIKTSTRGSKRKGDGKRKRKKKVAAGSQDEEAEEDEEESGDEADLAKYDLWGSEDESSKTGGSSKTAGSSKDSKSKEGESSKSEDLEDNNGKTDSPGSKSSSKGSKSSSKGSKSSSKGSKSSSKGSKSSSKNSKKSRSRSRSRSSSSSSSGSSSSSSGSPSSSQSASGSPKNKFDDFNLNSEREMSPRPRNSRSPRPRISAPLPRRKSHDSRGSNGESRSHEASREKEWSRDRERRPERGGERVERGARGARSGDRKERRYSRDAAGAGRHR